MAVRAVLDTQVVVRGLLGIRHSACAHVFEALAESAFTALVSPQILTELRAVLSLRRLRERYLLTDDQIAEFLDAYAHAAELVPGAPEGERARARRATGSPYFVPLTRSPKSVGQGWAYPTNF